MEEKIKKLILEYKKSEDLEEKINEEDNRFSDITYDQVEKSLSRSMDMPDSIDMIDTKRNYIVFSINGDVKDVDMRRIGFQLDRKKRRWFYPV